MSTRSRVTKLAASTVGGAAIGTVGAATVLARLALTPDRRRRDDTTVVAVDGDIATLALEEHSRVPGRYGVWLPDGGHARLSELVDVDEELARVRWRVESVDRGTLAPGRARWNAYYYWGAPDVCLSVPTERVVVDTELGVMGAWLVPSGDGGTKRWAILIHGRGGTREETVRAVTPLRDNGFTCLAPTYRNDEGSPAGPDGRYNLGLSEWRDIDAALVFAVAHGAQHVVLVGWSMGGAIALQLLARSVHADVVDRVVLDSPVVDWDDVLAFHTRLHHVPAVLGSLGRFLMGHPWARRLVGVHSPLDVAETDWVRRADELDRPVLLIHSDDDEFVPVGPSRELARRRPDLVTFEEWHDARHCQEWNTDPERWERVVAEFVSG